LTGLIYSTFSILNTLTSRNTWPRSRSMQTANISCPSALAWSPDCLFQITGEDQRRRECGLRRCGCFRSSQGRSAFPAWPSPSDRQFRPIVRGICREPRASTLKAAVKAASSNASVRSRAFINCSDQKQFFIFSLLPQPKRLVMGQ